MSKFELDYPLIDLVPASYNPRSIAKDALTMLQASLHDLGPIKPVIVTTGKTLVAGHQRTKAMDALGWQSCPAFILPPVGITDEVRFNQLHNASDLDKGDAVVYVPQSDQEGFVWTQWSEIHPRTLRVKNAPKKTEIMRLLTKYGDWGSCVALQNGTVLVSGLYAIAAYTLRRPLLVYYVADTKADLVNEYFGRPYGAFSYDHLERTTWAQSLAQMMRLREPKAGKLSKSGDPKGKSRTYENLVLPRLKRGMRILDFGAGQMDYVKEIQARRHLNGVKIMGVEFYLRTGRHLNVPRVQEDITRLCTELRENGRFDLVVCDSVLNSVDSLQAQEDVLTCLEAFVKPGGTVIFSGRTRDSAELRETEQTTHSIGVRTVNFFDENGFSAMFSQGVWRYQLFHTLPQIEALAEKHFGKDYQVYDSDGRIAKVPMRETGWGVVATSEHKRSGWYYIPSLEREFDLPLPGGKSFGRSRDIVDAWRVAVEKETYLDEKTD